MIRLYHGTSSKRASKIVGGGKVIQEGFSTKKYDCVFFAEDIETAKHFAGEKAHDAAATAQTTGNDEHTPKYFTVIEFNIPADAIEELELTREKRKPLGEHTGMSFPDILNGTGYERILIGNEAIEKFNTYISNGTITFRRLKYQRSGETSFF